MKMKVLMIVFMLFTGSFLLSAQEKTVSGVVTSAEDGLPLPGVTVLIKGTSDGTSTDFDGKFSLNVAGPDAVLIFTFIGFETQEIPVGNQSKIDIVMKESASQLEELVVIGYGTTTEKELTGAVSVVKAEAIESLNPTRVEQALQGQTAGVQISSQSGSPGGGFNVRIRGISTNGDNNPLILVDGVRYDDLSALDPSTIESVNILKDASASIYGVLAANGVVLITTKQGSKDSKTKFTFDAYYGVQETMRKIPVLNATEYAALANEAFANGGQAIPFPNLSGLGEGTDWQDEVFQTAPIQNYRLNAMGGSAKSTFSIGVGYFDQEGIVGGENASFQRLTLNLNTTTGLSESIKLNNVINYTNSNRKTLVENALGSVLFNALNMAPTLTPRDADGNFTLADGLGGEVINPLAQIADTYNDTWTNRVSGLVGLDIETPVENLTVSSSLAYNFSHVRYRGFFPESFYGIGKVFNRPESSVAENQAIYYNLSWDSYLKYDFDLNDVHKFSVTLGSSIFKNGGEFIGATGFGIPNNDPSLGDLSQANEIREGGATSFQYDTRQLSYFGRVEYNFNYKYLASIIVRRDGTTRFGPENRFGYFPSASVGWVLSEEDFLRGSDVLPYAKLRASYGITGNDKIGDFRYISLLNGESTYVFGGNDLRNGLALGALANPNIAWERNKQLDIGLDLELFDGKIMLTTDYFVKTSEDLLLAVPASALTGVAAPGSGFPFANAGSIRNTGIELQINYSTTIGDDFKLDVGYNVTKLTNETLRLNDGVAFIQDGQFGIGQLPPNRWQVGMPIGFFYGLQTDGIFQNQSEIEGSAQVNNATPGDLRYVDQNNDGQITADDRVMIGNPIPDYMMGFTLNAAYKGFDFSFFADAQLGNEVIRNYERNLPLTNKTAYYLDRWNGEGTSNDFPKISTGANDNDLFSDFWVEDGSYMRIKNIQLGYTLPEAAISKIGFQSCRIYASVNNLYTFTNYSGYDPNISSGSAVAAGNDIGYYPQPRTYIFGIKASF